MKIIRYQDRQGNIGHAELFADGTTQQLSGDLFAGLQPSNQPVEVAVLLAPIAPVAIVCIGLNYRRHAEETRAKIPRFPVVFTKGLNTLQHPGQPIELPRHLRSDEVDYECELAVVIGKRAKNVTRARDRKSVV